MRHLPRLTTLLLCAACAPGDEAPAPEPTPYAPPAGATVSRYAPFDDLDTFPDASQMVPDAASRTGWRVQLTEGAREALDAVVDPARFTIVDALHELDGFGRSGGITLRFNAAVDGASAADALIMVRVEDGEEVALDVEVAGDGLDLTVQPRLPLDAATAYAVALREGALDAQGAPIYASTRLRQVVSGGSLGDREYVGELWEDALDALALRPEEVVHGAVFVTQSSHTQDAALLDLLIGSPPALRVVDDCQVLPDHLRCPAVLEVIDVLGEDGLLPLGEVPVIQRRIDVPAAIWLPGDGSGGPFPTVLHGHGLGGSLNDGDGQARRLVGLGFAVVATDAPRHGNHPTNRFSDLGIILDFFGISLNDGSFSVAHLRDNFRAAMWERAQLAQAVLAGVDVSGDGSADLDGADLHLSGHSLGSVLGVGTLGLVPELASGHLSVPGGRVGTIVHRGGQFAPLIALMRPEDATQGDVDRFFPMLQAAIDPGEPLLWAEAAREGRDLFATMVIDDNIIPNECTEAVARALDLPLVGEVLRPIADVAVASGELPIQGNADGRTRGMYQLDEVLRGDERVRATHVNAWRSGTEDALVQAWYGGLVDGLGVLAPLP